MTSQQHAVHPELQDLLEPIESLEQHPDNPREHDLDAIRESLMFNGMYRPILGQISRRRILAGHGTWTAALSLGWTHIAVAWLDVDDDLARRILLADNRYPELSRNDPAALLELLDGLNGDYGGTAYTSHDHTELLAALDAQGVTGATGEASGPSTPGRVVSPGTDLRQLTLNFARDDFDQLMRWLNGLRVADDDTFTAIIQRCVAAALATR